MLIILATLFVQALAVTPFPPPTGLYHVGYTHHVFKKTTSDDPVAPANTSLILLATAEYPDVESSTSLMRTIAV